MAEDIFFPEIQLKEVILKDFRGQPNITINFDEKLTVIIGNNGSGKTTILDGIAGLLHYFVYQTILPNETYVDVLKTRDVKNDQQTAKGSIDLNLSYEFLTKDQLQELFNIIDFINNPLIGGNIAEIRYTRLNDEDKEENWFIVIDDDKNTEHWLSASWANITIEQDYLRIAKSVGNKWVLDIDFEQFVDNQVNEQGGRKASEKWNSDDYLNEKLSLRFDFNKANNKPNFGHQADDANITLRNLQISYANQLANRKERMPFLAYYGGKSIDAAFDYSALFSLSMREAYQNTLIPSKFSLSIFFNWFEQKQKIANEKLRAESTNVSSALSSLLAELSDNTFFDLNKFSIAKQFFEDLQGVFDDSISYFVEGKELYIVKNAILTMLNEGDEEDKIYSNLRIEYPQGQPEMLIEKKNVSKELNINQLSSGERNLLALVGDIAIRLIQLNPKVDNPLKEGRGIVLIDEIDLHLHPLWQRKVIPKLRGIFREIQFVVTTHSPFVVQSVEAHQRFILDDKGIRVLERDDDLSYEAIVNDYFNINELFDIETELLLEKFNDFKAQILKKEISIHDKGFLTLLKVISEKSNQVKDLVARELRYIKSQLQ